MPKTRKGVSLKPSEAGSKGDYNPKDFIVPASDDKGHSTRLQCRCNQAYARRIAVIISSGKFPYQTSSDLIRDAINRHLNLLSELEPKIPVDMASLEMVNKIINADREQIEFAGSFEKLSRTVLELLGRGAKGEARRLVLEVAHQVDRMEAGYWRDWYRQEIKNRFGYLLEKEG